MRRFLGILFSFLSSESYCISSSALTSTHLLEFFHFFHHNFLIFCLGYYCSFSRSFDFFFLSRINNNFRAKNGCFSGTHFHNQSWQSPIIGWSLRNRYFWSVPCCYDNFRRNLNHIQKVG